MQVRYKEDFEKMKGQSLFVPGAELIHSKNISAVISEVGACYKDLPGTKLSVKNFAWKVSPCHFFFGELWQFQSKYKEEGKKEASLSLYSILPETPETQHAREASELQSEVNLTPPLHLAINHTKENVDLK